MNDMLECVVRPGRSVVGHDGELHGSGKIILLCKDVAEKIIANGYVRPLGSNQDAPKQMVRPLGSDLDLTPEGKNKPIEEIEVQERPTFDGKWNMDPEFLQDKTLDQLNAMVVERDEKIIPFEDKKEAATHLSQDFDG